MNLRVYLRGHKKNDDGPYVLGGLAGIFAFLVFGIFGLSVIDHYALRSNTLAAVISAVLIDLTNGDRGENSLGGLTMNPLLTAAAQAKANDMAAKSYFAHISPDGRDSWSWFKEAGYAFTYAGENLAVDFSDSIDVERAWMNSPSHRANILNGHFTQIGIATAQGTYKGHPTTFVVQMFGSPAAAASAAPVRTLTSPSEPTAPAFATTETPEPIAQTEPTASTDVQTAVLGTEAGSAESSGNELPEAGSVTNEVSNGASWWQHAVASPRAMLQYAYYILAIVILIFLAYVTELELKRHHLRHVGAAVFLFVFMAGLFLFADIIFFSQPILAAGL